MKSIIVPPLNCFKVMPRGRDFDTPVTMAEASRWIFMPVLRDPSRHHGIGKVADTRQVFWEYFGGRRVFHVPRICGRQTFWFNGVVYSRELFGRHKYRCARFSLASSETGFIPPSVFYISVRQEEISRNSFRKVPCPLGCRGKFYFKSALEHSPLTMEYFSRSVVLFENKGFEFRAFRRYFLWF